MFRFCSVRVLHYAFNSDLSTGYYSMGFQCASVIFEYTLVQHIVYGTYIKVLDVERDK